MKKKVILIIRDGWGARDEKNGNCVSKGKTVNTDFYEKNFPYTELFASGEEVGIPNGKIGNSEVGHLHIGAGKIIEQSLLQINNSIKNKTFFKNKTFLKSLKNAQENNSNINIIILLQEAGVHSFLEHLFSYLEFLKINDFNNFNLHLITDGRDHNPKTAIKFIEKMKEKFGQRIEGKIKTISGRFFAMDRNNNLERTEKYFEVISGFKKDFKEEGVEEQEFKKSENYILENYEKNIFDEFVEPARKENYNGFQKNDSIIFLNFRTDRAKQISKKICKSNEIEKSEIKFFTMTKYYDNICSDWAYDFKNVENTLSEILIKNNKKQLRLAESEKQAHVTFFFDGQKKVENNLIEKIILESPKVKTYDLKPEMKAFELAEIAVNKIKENEKDFILMNFANGDMVGHTGKKDAILKAVEVVDLAIKKITDEALKNNWVVLLAADHGNAEEKTEKNKTSHTLNKIPFSIISNDKKLNNKKLKSNMGLKNIAPTVLEIMDIEKNKDMEESIIF